MGAQGTLDRDPVLLASELIIFQLSPHAGPRVGVWPEPDTN